LSDVQKTLRLSQSMGAAAGHVTPYYHAVDITALIAAILLTQSTLMSCVFDNVHAHARKAALTSVSICAATALVRSPRTYVQLLVRCKFRHSCHVATRSSSYVTWFTTKILSQQFNANNKFPSLSVAGINVRQRAIKLLCIRTVSSCWSALTRNNWQDLADTRCRSSAIRFRNARNGAHTDSTVAVTCASVAVLKNMFISSVQNLVMNFSTVGTGAKTNAERLILTCVAYLVLVSVLMAGDVQRSVLSYAYLALNPVGGSASIYSAIDFVMKTATESLAMSLVTTCLSVGTSAEDYVESLVCDVCSATKKNNSVL